jgi:DNA-binding Lrp family transcriptional regulator
MSILMQYKLDKINRVILYEMDKNCRISDNKLAKIVSRSRESIRNRINKLVKDNIIEGFVTNINPSRFGYLFFKLYFQLRSDLEEREKFFNYLKKIDGLYWYGTNDGIWDMHATIYSKSVGDFNDLKNEIYTNFKHLILKKDTGVLVKTTIYPKKYLLDKKEHYEETFFAGDLENKSVDELDLKILNELAFNARISLVELSSKVSSTIDIVRARMKKLEANQIITNYRIAVNHNKLEYIFFKSFLYFDNLSQNEKRRFLEFAKNSKNIIYVVEQLSAWDFEIEIMAESYEEFNKIMNDIRMKFKNSLRNYEFALMMEDVWVFESKKFLNH